MGTPADDPQTTFGTADRDLIVQFGSSDKDLINFALKAGLKALNVQDEEKIKELLRLFPKNFEIGKSSW